MACPLAAERIWVEKSRYHDAEREYYERLSKLLKGTVSDTQIDGLSSNVNCVKNKYRPRKIAHKSKSPEIMTENDEAVAAALKSTPNPSIARSKKQRKVKGADSEASSTNGVPTDMSANLAQDISQNIVTGEETKPKKKKKKKTNKDAAEKLHDISQKENVPPTPSTFAAKKDSQESNEKAKSLKNKGSSGSQCTLVSEIAKARQHIKNSLEKMDGIATLAASPASPDVLDRLAAVEKDNADLRKLIEGLKNVCIQSENRVKSLEQKLAAVNVNADKQSVSVKPVATSTENKADEDDGVDLFASDSDEEESAEAAKIREERLAAYAAKKSKKPIIIAKSSIVLDVKPWDDETDMAAMEAEVRKIVLDGMLWGASKYVPVAFGIKKLSISCVVEDDKVSVDGLIEEIEKLEDYVQSVDVAAFNKI